MYDVLEVNMDEGTVRVLSRSQTENNAEAYIKMAVYRRGVEDFFFVMAEAGRFQDGDKYAVDMEPECP